MSEELEEASAEILRLRAELAEAVRLMREMTDAMESHRELRHRRSTTAEKHAAIKREEVAEHNLRLAIDTLLSRYPSDPQEPTT